MVIVSPTVKANQAILDKVLDLRRCRIDHSYNWIPLTLKFPVHKEEVREYLHIIEYQSRVFVGDTLGMLIRLKVHLVDKLNAIVCLVGTFRCKCQHSCPHIRHIKEYTLRISILQYLVDEVDRGLGSGMNLFVKVSFDKSSDSFLCSYGIKIYHFFSFQWKIRTDFCDG